MEGSVGVVAWVSRPQIEPQPTVILGPAIVPPLQNVLVDAPSLELMAVQK